MTLLIQARLNKMSDNSSLLINRTKKNSKPTIGVTGPNKGGHMAWFFSALQIKLAGGRPIRIRTRNFSIKQISRIDGLVIGGGTDVHPQTYGQKPEKETDNRKTSIKILEFLLYPLSLFERFFGEEGFDQERDQMEVLCIQQALKDTIPILGICRGHQLIHVCFGKKLNQSTLGFYKRHPRIRTLLPRKKIILDPHSYLSRIIEKKEICVNALHSQCISEEADGFKTSAKELNGIIQASEKMERQIKILTVQWHPEYLPFLKNQRKLFQWLIKEANRR